MDSPSIDTLDHDFVFLFALLDGHIRPIIVTPSPPPRSVVCLSVCSGVTKLYVRTDACTVNAFKARLGKFRQHQLVKFDSTVDLMGTGNRSEVIKWYCSFMIACNYDADLEVSGTCVRNSLLSWTCWVEFNFRSLLVVGCGRGSVLLSRRCESPVKNLFWHLKNFPSSLHWVMLGRGRRE